MALNLLNDVGAPAAVTVVNSAARASAKTIGGMPVADVAAYAMTAGGYILGGWMNYGGRYNGFLKNLGIAAAPLAMDKLYNLIRGQGVRGQGVSRSVRMGRVSRYPAPAQESPFQGVRLV